MRKQRDVTAASIAEKLELSRSTVSLVLSGRAKAHRIAESTTRRVLETARAMNYRPNAAAQQLKGKRSNAIGVLVTSELMIDLRLIEAMEIIGAEHGIRFIVGHAMGSIEQIRDYIGDFRSRGVDGLFSFFHHHPRHGAQLVSDLQHFKSVVYYERPMDLTDHTPPGACFVGPDFSKVGHLTAQHLVDTGRRRIGMVLREQLFPYAIQRQEAHHQVMRESRRPLSPELTWVMTERTGRRWTESFTAEMALDAIDQLVVRGRVDGILAVNDLYAAALLCGLRKRGIRVPDDVAVVGCDNLDFAALMDPPLTTVDLQLGELARRLMDMMLTLLEDRTIPEKECAVLVEPSLIVRSSSDRRVR